MDLHKRDFVWIGLIVVLLSVGFGIAYVQPIPENGHGGDNIWVNLNGTERTLQSALNALSNGAIGASASGGMSFGDLETLSSNSGQASTDGYIMVVSTKRGMNLHGKIGVASASITVQEVQNLVGDYIDYVRPSLMFPVPKDYYWSVEVGSNRFGGAYPADFTVYWIPVSSGSGGSYGDWVTVDSVGNTLAGSSVYMAECDGFISFYATGGGGTTFIYVGDSSNPSIGVAGSDAINGQEAGNAPIKQGEYVKVSGGTPDTIRWRPIGDCNLIKQ